MCGFVGLVDFNIDHSSFEYNNKFIQRKLVDLRRRGPDKSKVWISQDQSSIFGFARLAIRDLSEAGDQPMVSKDKKWVITFNGEIYNTDHLKKWAEINSADLKGDSDTEILIECISKKGFVDTIEQLDGIFAISCTNLEDNELYLVRDHVGIKPLYFGLNNKGFVFSSHYHHVLQHRYFKSETILEESLQDYFKFGLVLPGKGIFTNTFFVPLKEIIIIDLNNSSFQKIPYNIKFKFDSGDLHTILKKTIESQLISDVPIGTFLSSGIDSSLVAAIANSIDPSIRSFTIGVNDQQLDEGKEAKSIADKLGVNHHVEYFKEEELIQSIKNYEESSAEPLADFSSIITLKVCELAKKELTVVLSGDGGDELFFGYSRFKKLHDYYPYLSKSKTQRFFKIVLARFKGEQIPFNILRYQGINDFYLDAQGLLGNADWNKKILKSNDFKSKGHNKAKSYTLESALDLAREIEMNIHLQRVLLKVDRASMYNSLEVRTPLLSPSVIQKAQQFEFSECYIDNKGKKPLRDLLKSFFPKGDFDNFFKVKKGFSPPLASWLRNELKDYFESILNNAPKKIEALIDEKEVLKIWNDHQKGISNNEWAIWAVYSLYTWIAKLDEG